MSFARKIERFLFPCQIKIDRLVSEYNQAFDEIARHCEKAKRAVIDHAHVNPPMKDAVVPVKNARKSAAKS